MLADEGVTEALMIVVNGRDVHFKNKYFSDYFVRKGWCSKTDQQKSGAMIPLRPCSNKDLCPVSVLLHYLVVWGQDDGKLFQHAVGSQLAKLSFWMVTTCAFVSVSVY